MCCGGNVVARGYGILLGNILLISIIDGEVPAAFICNTALKDEAAVKTHDVGFFPLQFNISVRFTEHLDGRNDKGRR